MLVNQALRLLGMQLPGWRVDGKRIDVDQAQVVTMYARLQGHMDRVGQELQAEHDQALQRAKELVKQRRVAQLALANGAGGSSSGTNTSTGTGTGSGTGGTKDEIETEDESGSSDDTTEEAELAAKRAAKQRDMMHRRAILSLQRSLRPCVSQRMQLVGTVLNEAVFPSFLFHPAALQSMALFTVLHCIEHGLCGGDGFSFSMLGASTLAIPVAHPTYVASHGVQWGQLGTRVCISNNNQTDLCRALYANALFINSFTGHLERSILELQQSIFIGGMAGDLHFVAHAQLAVVILQQYTSSLSEWEELVRQAAADNTKLLNDYAVAAYCRSMLLLLPVLQRGTGRLEQVQLSSAEHAFVVEARKEAEFQGLSSSLALCLFAITKAKLQLLFHHPLLAQETLRMVDVERLAGQPEVVGFYLVDSLSRLACMRLLVDGWVRMQALTQMDGPSSSVQEQDGADESTRHHSRVQGRALSHGSSAAAAGNSSSRPTAPAAAAGASDRDDESPMQRLVSLCAAHWAVVARNQERLRQLSEHNIRDFQCQYLLVRAEQAYTTLYAFDQNVVWTDDDALSEELLPPQMAREHVESAGARRREIRRDRAQQQQQQQQPGRAGATAEWPVADSKSAANPAQLLMAQQSKDAARNATVKAKQASIRSAADSKPSSNSRAGCMSFANGGSSSRRTALGSVPAVAEGLVLGSRRKKTLLTRDPLLRDLLAARIALVYTSAAALTISSRSSSVGGGNHNGCSDDGRGISRSGNSGSGSRGQSRGSSAAYDSSNSQSYTNSTVSETSTTSRTGRGGSGTFSTSGGGHEGNHLRQNSFVEGLANELACRFQYYIARPQQATNHLLIALRAYTRWGAQGLVHMLQKEFQTDLVDVLTMLGLRMPGPSHMSMSRASIMRPMGMPAPPRGGGPLGVVGRGPGNLASTGPMRPSILTGGSSTLGQWSSLSQNSGIVHRRLPFGPGSARAMGPGGAGIGMPLLTAEPSFTGGATESMHSFQSSHQPTYLTTDSYGTLGASLGAISYMSTHTMGELGTMTFEADFGSIQPLDDEQAADAVHGAGGGSSHGGNFGHGLPVGVRGVPDGSGSRVGAPGAGFLSHSQGGGLSQGSHSHTGLTPKQVGRMLHPSGASSNGVANDGLMAVGSGVVAAGGVNVGGGNEDDKYMPTPIILSAILSVNNVLSSQTGKTPLSRNSRSSTGSVAPGAGGLGGAGSSVGHGNQVSGTGHSNSVALSYEGDETSSHQDRSLFHGVGTDQVGVWRV